MAAPESLQVGAVGQRDLDLHQHVAGSRLRTWNLFEPEITRGVEAQRSHGVKTTFSAAPDRYSSRPCSKLLERQDGRLRELDLPETRSASTHVSRRRGA